MAFIGDGTSTTAEFDLAVAPFNLNFNSNPPVAVQLVSFQPDSVAGLTLAPSLALHHSAVHLVLQFSVPIPAGNVNCNASVQFIYEGVV